MTDFEERVCSWRKKKKLEKGDVSVPCGSGRNPRSLSLDDDSYAATCLCPDGVF